MQHRPNLLYVTVCLVIWTTQWADVISASLADDNVTAKSKGATGLTELSKDESSSTAHFYSDELISDEYEDDLDADFRVQRRQREEDHEWDLLIFTQQWPVTSCYHWREEDKTNTCLLPANRGLWTIHGIWPTKYGHIGPSFCNKTADFNLTVLEEIIDPLNEYWPTIEGGEDHKSDGLWKHEWLKHGTCAAAVEELNNELKYFSQGLNWRDNFLLSDILANSGILPDSNNTVIAVHTALVKVLGKNPSIHCIYDNKNEISYLEEIRICFDKELQLSDCDGVPPGDAVSIDYPGGTVNTNCHISKPVHYPSNVPPVQHKPETEWKFPVVNMYKLLQFIMWFTL